MKRRYVQPRDLPHELITDNIFTRLPIKPLVRFKSISKQWYSTISSPQFAHTHFKFPKASSRTESLIIQSNNKFQILSYDDNDDQNAQIANKCETIFLNKVDFDAENERLVLVGTCNGLVCLGSISGRLFIIWNPITGEFHKYSDSEISEDFSKECSVTWGFGYVSAADDYKVVRIRSKGTSPPFSAVDIFSIKQSKRRRTDQDFHLLKIARFPKPGVLLSETLYWMPLGLRLQMIFFFDLALELFDVYPHLLKSPVTAFIDNFLFVLEGCLSKFGCLYFSSDGVITILKRPGQTEQISVPPTINGRAWVNLIGFTSSDKFFIQSGVPLIGFTSSDTLELAIFDPSSRPMKHTPLITFEGNSEIEISSYSPTLISLNGYQNIDPANSVNI